MTTTHDSNNNSERQKSKSIPIPLELVRDIIDNAIKLGEDAGSSIANSSSYIHLSSAIKHLKALTERHTNKGSTQKKLAITTGVSQGFICQIIAGLKRPSWQTAKKLAEATSTTPILWLEGTPDQIRDAIKNASQN